MARAVAATGLATGLAAVTVAAPGTAHAATEYDGDATALRIEGLSLQLFPNGTEGLPPELRTAIADLQQHAPEELQRDRLRLVMPDEVIGHATYPGTDTKVETPDNPLLTAEALEARSVKTPNGDLVSEASVAGLALGGGVLSADVIRTQCTGDGQAMSVDISQLQLSSNEQITDSEVTLQPGQAVPIEGVGTITFNQQDTDGSTYAEGTNVVIDLDSDLSLDALARLFDTTAPAVEAALKEVLTDLGRTEVGPDGERPLQPLLNEENVDKLEGQQVYDGFDQALDQLAQEAPPELRDALNNIAHLDGTVTVANAACSQATVVESGPQPAPQQAAPAQPVADREPPLADTGSPAGMAGLGAAGLAALAAGAWALLRLRRREA